MVSDDDVMVRGAELILEMQALAVTPL